MKIVTWNVNGIRSFDGKWKSVMESFDADIICVQETKVTSMYLKVNEIIKCIRFLNSVLHDLEPPSCVMCRLCKHFYGSKMAKMAY